MTSTLALDLATATGWAIRRADGTLESGVARFDPVAHKGEGFRFSRFRAFFHETKGRLERLGEPIGLVVYERPAGGRWMSADACEVILGLRAHLLQLCDHHGLPTRGVAPIRLKTLITGNHRADKEAVKAAVNARLQRKPPVRDHNEADALALLLTIAPERIAA